MRPIHRTSAGWWRFLHRPTSAVVDRWSTISSDGFHTTSTPMPMTSAGVPKKASNPIRYTGRFGKRSHQLMARDGSTRGGRLPVAE